MESRNIKRDIISDLIWVSSAMIVYSEELYPYCQYETFIFSTDHNLKTKQIIHGCSHGVDYEDKILIEKTIKAHDNIVSNLKAHFKNQ